MADVPPSESGPTTRKVQDGARHPRLARELKTIRAMARIYCRKHHGTGASDGLCVECEALLRLRHPQTRSLRVRRRQADLRELQGSLLQRVDARGGPRRHALCRAADALAASGPRHRASARRAPPRPRSADAEPDHIRGDGSRTARPRSGGSGPWPGLAGNAADIRRGLDLRQRAGGELCGAGGKFIQGQGAHWQMGFAHSRPGGM